MQIKQQLIAHECLSSVYRFTRVSLEFHCRLGWNWQQKFTDSVHHLREAQATVHTYSAETVHSLYPWHSVVSELSQWSARRPARNRRKNMWRKSRCHAMIHSESLLSWCRYDGNSTLINIDMCKSKHEKMMSSRSSNNLRDDRWVRGAKHESLEAYRPEPKVWKNKTRDGISLTTSEVRCEVSRRTNFALLSLISCGSFGLWCLSIELDRTWRWRLGSHFFLSIETGFC